MPVKGSAAPSQGTGDAAVHSIDEVGGGGRIIDRVPRIRKGRQPGPRRRGCGPSLGISDGILNAMTLAASTEPHGFSVIPYSGAGSGNTTEITALYTGYRTRAVAGHVGVCGVDGPRAAGWRGRLRRRRRGRPSVRGVRRPVVCPFAALTWPRPRRLGMLSFPAGRVLDGRGGTATEPAAFRYEASAAGSGASPSGSHARGCADAVVDYPIADRLTVR